MSNTKTKPDITRGDRYREVEIRRFNYAESAMYSDRWFLSFETTSLLNTSSNCAAHFTLTMRVAEDKMQAVILIHWHGLAL